MPTSKKARRRIWEIYRAVSLILMARKVMDDLKLKTGYLECPAHGVYRTTRGPEPASMDVGKMGPP